MNWLVTGDFFISDDHCEKDLFGPSVKALFADADYRVVNLEAPITIGNKDREILKTGPHLHTTKEAALPALGKLGIDMVTLANNHIMDYGWAGLRDTLENLGSAGIAAVGAGRNLAEAAKSLILDKKGLRLAVLNLAENEWASATPTGPGANTLDLRENLKQIQEAKRDCEFVVVIIHGGYEDHHFPSPGMVRQYRSYVESGASAVIGHHPHCISGYEVYKGAPIFYSLGNFLFTRPSPLESWYTGLILVLSLEKDREISWNLIPVLQSRTDYTLTLPEGKKKEAIRDELEGYSQIIADETLLNQRWQTFLSDWKGYYLGVFSPLNFIPNDHLKLVLKKLGLDRLFMRKKHYAEILNHIRCEAHAEAAKGVIKHFLE